METRALFTTITTTTTTTTQTISVSGLDKEQRHEGVPQS